MREGVTWVILPDTFPDILIFIIVLYICNLLNYYYFHTLYYYYRRQEEPAILISGLLLRMRMYVVTRAFSEHSFGLPLRMNGMHITQFDHALMNLLSLVI